MSVFLTSAPAANRGASVKSANELRMAQLAKATEHLEPPFAVVDLDAFDSNATELAARTGGAATIRLASKSVRSRPLIRRVTARPGYRGILAFTLPEALLLAADHEDVVIGYPTADRDALRKLAGDEQAAARITLMIDSVEHLDFVDDAVGPARPDVRVCIDLDAALELLGGRIHLGPYRSPVHSTHDAATLARAISDRPGFRLVGVMSYEGQIAGLGDNQPGSPLRRAALRTMQRLSARELAGRRAAAIAAVEEIAPLEFVNGRRYRLHRTDLRRTRHYRSRRRIRALRPRPVRLLPPLPASPGRLLRAPRRPTSHREDRHAPRRRLDRLWPHRRRPATDPDLAPRASVDPARRSRRSPDPGPG
jgi:hypothetical protein